MEVLKDEWSRWYVRSRGGRLLQQTSSPTKEEARAKFLSGKRYPVWGPWFDSGYRLVNVILTVPVCA